MIDFNAKVFGLGIGANFFIYIFQIVQKTKTNHPVFGKFLNNLLRQVKK